MISKEIADIAKEVERIYFSENISIIKGGEILIII